MLIRICCELTRIGAGELHNIQVMMLLLSGQMTAEWECLLSFWQSFRDNNANEPFKNWEAQAYRALYGEIDTAFSGIVGLHTGAAKRKSEDILIDAEELGGPSL